MTERENPREKVLSSKQWEIKNNWVSISGGPIVGYHLLLLLVCAMLMFVCPDIQQNLRNIPPKENNTYKNNLHKICTIMLTGTHSQKLTTKQQDHQ